MGTTLGDILDHPQLYSAYPILAELPVRFSDADRLDNGDLAIYRRDINGNGLVELAARAPKDDLRSALLRVMQLAVNHLEE